MPLPMCWGMRSKTATGSDAASVYWYRAWRIVRFYSRLCARFPAALKLGLAGGPLIMALILGRIGSIGKLYWFMPPR